jgi:hypothetical protein
MSGAVIQSVHTQRSQVVFEDLDTGRRGSLPDRWADQKLNDRLIEEIIAWAAGEGYDLMGDEFVGVDGRRVYALRPIGLQAWELGNDRWKPKINRITLGELQQEGQPVKNWLLHVDEESGNVVPAATASFLFITREGSPGLIHVGVEVQDDTLKPGGTNSGDLELNPVSFRKGRRFGTTSLVPVE